ncbi:hypothetical protein LOTGIDRAFT_176346 [Lottia gigantea]|uniref:EF-hand domain-containing protein n=1 Tax=Lottia gigantea TaxID=225164 RepID=V4CPP7_LOTGI|nr:hypothetical protein LOTGIDRAFT_176346 [Lottia gigantea]ESP04380.1 hypothetical protein LOTGIDRAFT_176346 [Lottia gigantea]
MSCVFTKLQKESFTDKHCEILFGEVISAEEAFESLDKDEDGQVDFGELMEFIQRTGICMLDTFQGYSRQEISGFSSFVERVQNTILLNLKRVHTNRGYNAVKAFLQYHVINKVMVPEVEPRRN